MKPCMITAKEIADGNVLLGNGGREVQVIEHIHLRDAVRVYLVYLDTVTKKYLCGMTVETTLPSSMPIKRVSELPRIKTRYYGHMKLFSDREIEEMQHGKRA